MVVFVRTPVLVNGLHSMEERSERKLRVEIKDDGSLHPNGAAALGEQALESRQKIHRLLPATAAVVECPVG
jgi:hypothetical protein